MNAIHIDEIVHDSQDWVAASLAMAMSIKARCSAAVIIVSMDSDGCVLKFHMRRQGEAWLDDDVERYVADAVLVID